MVNARVLQDCTGYSPAGFSPAAVRRQHNHGGLLNFKIEDSGLRVQGVGLSVQG